MITKNIVVTNTIGLHARPASLLLDAASRYPCAYTLQKGEQATSLKSIIKLLALEVKCGDELTLSVDGENEEQAMNDLVSLFESKFGEI